MKNEINYKGAVFFDIDGTLVDERLEIYVPTKATKEAIAKLKENGYLTGIATGRSKGYMSDLGIDFDCIITSNGAAIEVNGKKLINECISHNELIPLIDFLDKNNIAYDVETFDRCYFGRARRELLEKFLDIFNVDTSAFLPFESLDGLEVNKIVFAFDEERQYKRLVEAFDGKFKVNLHHGYNSGDVSRAGITKASGIKNVIKHFGIDIKNTYAFGDDENDLDMLTTVGWGVAMTPHSPLLDGVVKKYTRSVGEEGVAVALSELGLI